MLRLSKLTLAHFSCFLYFKCTRKFYYSHSRVASVGPSAFLMKLQQLFPLVFQCLFCNVTSGSQLALCPGAQTIAGELMGVWGVSGSLFVLEVGGG